MKKIHISIILSLLCCYDSHAQDAATVKKLTDQTRKELDAAQALAEDTTTTAKWKIGGTGNATFNQVGLKNWAAGGDPSFSFLFQLNGFVDYKNHNHLWQNYLKTDYGLEKIRGESIRKNSDKLELGTKYGYKVSKFWYLSSIAVFKTQFSKTEDYASDVLPRRTLSKTMSPATLDLAIGMDYQPNELFSIFMSPLAARLLFVTDDSIAALNIHGNEYSNLRKELGATIIVSYNQEIFKNVSVSTLLRLFKDYLKGPVQNIDVDWQTTFGFKVNDFLSASVFTHLIWDYDVLVLFDVDDNGTISEGEQARKLQFKDVIGIGISYNFGDKKKKG